MRWIFYRRLNCPELVLKLVSGDERVATGSIWVSEGY